MKVKVAQLCLTLCEPMDCSLSGSSVLGNLQWRYPSPGDLPNPKIEPRSPALQADSLPSEPPGKPKGNHKQSEKKIHTMGENICKANNKGSNSKIFKQPMQISITNNPDKKYAEDLNRHFSKDRQTDGQKAREKMHITNY